MATVLSHSLVGLALLPLAPSKIPRAPLFVALMLLPILPDIDVLSFSLNIPYSDPLGHRGFTHSVLFALIAGFLSSLFFIRCLKPFGSQCISLGLLLSCAIATHGILDAMTDAGLGVAFGWPIDNTRYFFPWRPLATSPIGIESFFKGDFMAIFKNELIWIWLPTSLVFLSFVTIKKRRKIKY